MEEGAHRFHAGKNAHHKQDNHGNCNGGKGNTADKANRIHNVGQHMLASALRRIQARSCLTQKAQRKGHNDKAQATDKVHYEAPHVVGGGKVLQIDNERNARGGESGNRFHKGVEVRTVMAGKSQGNRSHKRQNNPRKASYRERLLVGKLARLHAHKAQPRSDNKRNAHRQQIARSRLPFLHCNGNHQRHRQRNGEERNQHTKVVRYHTHIKQSKAKPHATAPPCRKCAMRR